MQGKIHKEMAYCVIEDYQNSALEFLLNGISKPEWEKDIKKKIEWLKVWFDMPDDTKHGSKSRNDHSYKITKSNGKFKIVFAKTGADQATVVARLKYSVRDTFEWIVEEEYRTGALELAKSIHWVIDMSSPSHTCSEWDADKYHSKVETQFDSIWQNYYDQIKPKLKFKKRGSEIKDIYRWAKKFIEEKYERNLALLNIYKAKGSIKEGEGKNHGLDIIQDLAQNMIDYLAYVDKKIDFEKVTKLLTDK